MSKLATLSAIAAVLTAVCACAPESPDSSGMADTRAVGDSSGSAPSQESLNESQMAALRTVAEVWDSGDVAMLDGTMAAGVTRTAPDQGANSLAEYKAFLQQVHTAYPDFRLAADAVAAGPEGGFLMWTVTGTNTGEGPQPPTGNSIELTGISYYQFEDGKITSERVVFDSQALLSQLEADEMTHVE